MPSNRLCISPSRHHTRSDARNSYERRFREVEVAILNMIVDLEITDGRLRRRALEVGQEVMRQLREELATVVPQ